jgi:hypothetical protein
VAVRLGLLPKGFAQEIGRSDSRRGERLDSEVRIVRHHPAAKLIPQRKDAGFGATKMIPHSVKAIRVITRSIWTA